MLGFHLSPAAIPSVPDPLAPYFSRGGGQSIAIAEGVAGNLSIWSELADGHAAWLTLDNNDPTQRLSWRETLLAKLRSVYPVGAMTLSGSWNQMQSSGSGLAASYTGNRAVSTGSPAATAEVVVDRSAPYDLWVHFTGRTTGGYVKVQIDGGDALVNAIEDPAGLGFKAFSTYSAVDLSRRQVIRVATGLTGSHQVTLSYGGPANPGGAAILIEAVSISAGLADPRILPPMWEASTAYAMGDEVQWQGTYYSARANGTSSATPPTHTSGIASDGALDWRADNRPSYPEFVAIDYASEREYAARFSVAGQISEVGGQTHGNEPLASRSVLLDGAAWVPVTSGSGLSVGASITIAEQTEWQTVSATKVADCTLLRTITPGEIRHDVSIAPTGPQADVEWFYAGMLPMVHWDGESGMQVFGTVASADTAVALANHAGQNPPNIDLGHDGRIGLTAQIGTTELRYGLSASIDTGGLTEAIGSFLRPNIDARTASGSLDWTAKAYVEPTMAGGWGFAASDTITLVNRHVLSVR